MKRWLTSVCAWRSCGMSSNIVSQTISGSSAHNSCTGVLRICFVDLQDIWPSPQLHLVECTELANSANHASKYPSRCRYYLVELKWHTCGLHAELTEHCVLGSTQLMTQGRSMANIRDKFHQAGPHETFKHTLSTCASESLAKLEASRMYCAVLLCPEL